MDLQGTLAFESGVLSTHDVKERERILIDRRMSFRMSRRSNTFGEPPSSQTWEGQDERSHVEEGWSESSVEGEGMLEIRRLIAFQTAKRSCLSAGWRQRTLGWLG
jgi:hypothetical protein